MNIILRWIVVSLSNLTVSCSSRDIDYCGRVAPILIMPTMITTLEGAIMPDSRALQPWRKWECQSPWKSQKISTLKTKECYTGIYGYDVCSTGWIVCFKSQCTPLWKSNRNIFWHKFITIYFLLFARIFIHDICEVVNINSNNFCWISIIGYTSETFWKRLLGQNPMSYYSDYCRVQRWNWNIRKKTGIGA